MAKIFNKIRKKLIEEDNFKNYLKYAVGEIILLVIGIFIALQINNWNNSRKDYQKEEGYLKNIKRDLNEQVINIHAQIVFETTQLTNANALLNAIDNNLYLADSLLDKIITLTSRRTFIPDDPTFQDLKSSGNLTLIRNIDLRDNLIKYYQTVAYETSVIGKNNTSFIDDEFSQNAISNSFINYTRKFNSNSLSGLNVFVVSKNTLSIIDENIRKNLMNNDNKVFVMNLLSDRYYVSGLHKNRMEKLKTKTMELLELVEKEID